MALVPSVGSAEWHIGQKAVALGTGSIAPGAATPRARRAVQHGLLFTCMLHHACVTLLHCTSVLQDVCVYRVTFNDDPKLPLVVGVEELCNTLLEYENFPHGFMPPRE